LSARDIAAIEPRLACKALKADGGWLALPGFADSHVRLDADIARVHRLRHDCRKTERHR
jgi:dihydroorotase-like cyclic amidohydrolase